MPTGDRVAVVIEDDTDIRNLLVAILDQAGFTCFSAETGLDGIQAVREHQPILTTLDVSLPGIDGFEVARRIRSFSRTYIIILSARNEEIDTLMGLDAGADDYLTKPFRPRELRARIEAMLRRYQVPAGHEPRSTEAKQPIRTTGGRRTVIDEGGDGSWLSHNGLRVNPDMWRCEVDGETVELTRSEFDLLLVILQANRRVISKEALAKELRGDYARNGFVSDSDRRAVEVHVANLRRKLRDPVSAPCFVETVRGVGYRLASPR